MTTAADLLALGPDACYLFDETSGTVLEDATPNGRDGTYSGGFTLGQPGLTADSTAAVAFDGVSGRGTVPHATWLDYATALSVAVTGLVPSGFIDGYSTLVAVDGMFVLSVSEDTAGVGHVIWSLGTSAGGASAYSATGSVAVDTPFRAVGTFDGTTARLYLEGELVGETPLGGTLVSGGPLYFASYDGTDAYQCTVDEAAILGRVLSAGEVQAIHSTATATPPRVGFGIALDSSATVTVEPPLEVDAATVPLHIITPTVPVPVLVDGRPS